MAVQSQYLNTVNTLDIANVVPVQHTSKVAKVEQVMIVLSGHKQDEYILETALQHARTTNTTLVVVHAHQSSQSQSAELYLKSVKNKLIAQYDNVQAFLFEGTDKLSALDAMLDDNKQTCVILQRTSNWLQRFSTTSSMNALTNRANVQLWQVARQ